MPQRIASLLLVLVLAATAGCASSRDDEMDPNENAARLFTNAERSIRTGNYAAAIGALENLAAIYPFSEEARQAQLKLIFVYWRNEQMDAAITAADRFILENPTHPRVDYALYMKGVARFPRESGPLERLFRIDIDKRPPGEMQNAYNVFSQLIQQHPDSKYVADAYQRMIYLRNRMAAHEVHVAEFYMQRSAFVAAINRAQNVVTSFQETPSVRPALRIMADSYDRLGLEELAADTRRILAANR